MINSKSYWNINDIVGLISIKELTQRLMATSPLTPSLNLATD